MSKLFINTTQNKTMEAQRSIQDLFILSFISDDMESRLGHSDPRLVKSTFEWCTVEHGEKQLESLMKEYADLVLEIGFDSALFEFNENLQHQIQSIKNMLATEYSEQALNDHQKSLPIFIYKNALVNAVKEHQILIVCGEVGTGITTQIPQYLAEAGYPSFGTIACSQTRSIAALSSCHRVSKERASNIGEEVGFSISSGDCTSDKTKIKYTTDSVLLREYIADPDLKQYSVIMIDDAHNRTINTDLLLGLLKRTCQRRPDLKLIVTSANFDTIEKLSKYFSSAPIFTIPCRRFPVDIFFTKNSETNYLEATSSTVLQLHLTSEPGAILAFVPDQKAMNTVLSSLYTSSKKLGENVPKIEVVPVNSVLPFEMQPRIREPVPQGSRRVYLAACNELTAVNINDVRYVVDSGFTKHKVYNASSGRDEVVVTRISKAGAKTRAGCAGLGGPGKCYRLYPEATLKNEMVDVAVPEIQRVNLTEAMLILKAIGINDVREFDLIDSPSEASISLAMNKLHSLGALDDSQVTELGKKMALDLKIK